MIESPNLLELHNIRFCADDRTILNDFSLTLKPNEFKFITGPSGCGKSTVLKIASSLITPQHGDIFLHGKNIQQINAESYRKKVSYCFQTPVLFGQTVKDNLTFPYQIRGDNVDWEKINQGLEHFGLANSTLNKSPHDLSGGEKQRVALLRNLQYLPDVLLLDEITSALDEQNRYIVYRAIMSLINQHNIAVLWVSHNQEEIAQSDNVLYMQPSEETGACYECA